MRGLSENLSGSRNRKEIHRLEPAVQKISGLRGRMASLSDEGLADKTKEFKKRLSNGESLDDILPEAFAVVSEACHRVLKMRPFDVQLLGGIVLHQGRVAQMQTGEGKTLTAVLPVYLNALEGKGVHVVTVNDYLAKRDCEWMGGVYRFLGLDAGCVIGGMSTAERKTQYAKDITYVTNKELGFDWLRDNMAMSPDGAVLRGLHYAVIDEADSVLIDEARTPLIISGKGDESDGLCRACSELAGTLTRGKDLEEFSRIDAFMGIEREETGDYIVNEKDRYVTLTAEGVKKSERFFRISNLSDPENIRLMHGILTALKAKELMLRDRDYIVKDGKVLIVDEFTGRVMPSRRYSEGLHQAIEAKEGLKIQRESRTLGSVTCQNFFNKYEKKCGMTGTAKTEENEFKQIYGMDVVQIPTNRPVIRKDLEDSVFLTEDEKYRAVISDIWASSEKGQPVLVGTGSIEASEKISKMLKKAGIPHNVLNAKNNAAEAAVIEFAGEHGSVTIATNMAGRGTDIALDDKARAAGGLKVLGTQRHEARRIDDQLRGRSGRQGDPGESKFYLSLEDDLLRLFGSEQMLQKLKGECAEGTEISHRSLSKVIENAQKRIESNNFAARSRLFEFDRVVDEQRDLVYSERNSILYNRVDLNSSILHMIQETIGRIFDSVIPKERNLDKRAIIELNARLVPIAPFCELASAKALLVSRQTLRDLLIKEAVQKYRKMEAEYPDREELLNVERKILLKAIDFRWQNHLDAMNRLRQSVGLKAYGGKDPQVEYRMIGFEMFNEMTDQVMEDTVSMVLKIDAASRFVPVQKAS